MKNIMLIIGIMTISLIFSGNAFSEEARFATIQKIKGEVFTRTVGEKDWKSAEKGMILGEMAEIKTGPKSKAEIYLDEDAETGKFDMTEESLLRFSEMKKNEDTSDKTTLLDLAIGKVIIRAEKLTGASKFEVRTPTATTGVRGTVFEVSVE